MIHPDVSPCVLIATGLELEEQQYVIHPCFSCFYLIDIFTRRRVKAEMSARGPHLTERQEARILERNNALRSKIQSWYGVQQLYIPAAATLRAKLASDAPPGAPLEAAWEMRLFLPSEIALQASCDQKLRELEWQLREAQAYDALEELRDNLRVSTHLWKHKKRWTRGQRPNTRAKDTISKTQAKADAAAIKYQNARQALLRLGHILRKPTSWQEILRVLKKEDVRGLSEAALGDSEGKRLISWIWLIQGVGVSMNTSAKESQSLHDCECHSFLQPCAQKLRRLH
jgi:hypothetical protein